MFDSFKRAVACVHGIRRQFVGKLCVYGVRASKCVRSFLLLLFFFRKEEEMQTHQMHFHFWSRKSIAKMKMYRCVAMWKRQEKVKVARGEEGLWKACTFSQPVFSMCYFVELKCNSAQDSSHHYFFFLFNFQYYMKISNIAKSDVKS